MIGTGTRRAKRSPIGLDVGASGVRAVQLVRSGEEYSVTTSARLELGPSAADRPFGELPETIRRCVRGEAFRGKGVVAVRTGDDVGYHPLELPQALLGRKTDEAEKVVQTQIARLLPVSTRSVITSHWALPGSVSSAHNAIGVAVREDRITDLMEICKRSGLVCHGVDTPATALSRLGEALVRWPEELVWGILDLGHTQSRLVLCLEGVPVLVRNVGLGGNGWTERIASSLDLSLKAAEVHKREHGIASTGKNVRPDEQTAAPDSNGYADNLSSVLLGALRGSLNELASEVKRSYEYVLSCYPKRKAGDLILVGGGAAMPNLPDFLGGALGIPVGRVTTYLRSGGCRLHYASGRGEQFESLASAVGLALEA